MPDIKIQIYSFFFHPPFHSESDESTLQVRYNFSPIVTESEKGWQLGLFLLERRWLEMEDGEKVYCKLCSIVVQKNIDRLE